MSPTQVVIFGASGDLTSRKLIPALASLVGKGLPPEGLRVVGVSRRPKTDEAWRQELREAIPKELTDAFEKLAPHLGYEAGDVQSDDDLARLKARLDALPGGESTGRLFYLSLKPELFAPAVARLCTAGLLP
ncbi:MAG: glucose-6-phosphate dehydrogenase, partial [Polyangiales bacterium]